MEYISKITNGCCGKKGFMVQTKRAISKNHLDAFRSGGFIISDNYLRSGILYAENTKIIIVCTLGTNRIEVKSKINLPNLIESLETILANL